MEALMGAMRALKKKPAVEWREYPDGPGFWWAMLYGRLTACKAIECHGSIYCDFIGSDRTYSESACRAEGYRFLRIEDSRIEGR